MSGARTYDFNVDGLAHVGLLPDFLADLEVLGVPPADMEPMFHSAEAYVAMWERAVASAHTMQRWMNARVTPRVLLADQNVNFTVTTADRYFGEAVVGDVYVDGVHAGKTGDVITRSFASTLKKVCHYDIEVRRVICEMVSSVPRHTVRVTAPNYFDWEHDLNIEAPAVPDDVIIN